MNPYHKISKAMEGIVLDLTFNTSYDDNLSLEDRLSNLVSHYLSLEMVEVYKLVDASILLSARRLILEQRGLDITFDVLHEGETFGFVCDNGEVAWPCVKLSDNTYEFVDAPDGDEYIRTLEDITSPVTLDC